MSAPGLPEAPWPPWPGWGGLLAFTRHPLELMVRGSLMYGLLFLMFRFLLRRDAGTLGLADVLLVVLVADASQNAMAGDYRSVSDGVVLVGTIATWNWLIDWAGYHSPRLRRFLQAPATLLVWRGEVIQSHLRRELITREELMAAVHQQGLSSLAQVDRALMESDGRITVVPRAPADARKQVAPAETGPAPGPGPETAPRSAPGTAPGLEEG